MPRKKNAIPSYLHHKPTGQAFVRIPTENGKRRTIYLGEHSTEESKGEYRRILAELDAASPSAVATAFTASGEIAKDITLSEVYRDFWRFALQHYRRADNTPTNELAQYRQTFALVIPLYRSVPAREFGPLALKTVRQKMIDADWSRKLVNQRVGRIKRVFKWAASEQLVPVTTHMALATVAGLQAGRTTAAELDPVEPISDEVVDATLPHLNRFGGGMRELQRDTGMRPGEVCAIRWCDINMTGEVWFYRPTQHKTRHRGKSRVIALGPKAQAVLKQFPTSNPTDYLFNPRL